MKPVIAIIGRPNVGKSTLFNLLADNEYALVMDEPGVTHDRQYGFGDHQEHSFIVVDTGGLSSDSKATKGISQLISAQSLYAAAEADVLIWLVDGRQGLTVEDQHIAKILRPLCPNILLSVNKAEGLDAAVVASEFHCFGFNGPHVISAKRGSGISRLLDEASKHFPATSEHDEPFTDTDQLRISVLGRPNVGKSTLINRIIGEERMITTNQPGTTRDSIAIPFERNGRHYTLIDTAGIRRRAKIDNEVEKHSVIQAIQAINETQIIMLILDAQEAITEQDATLLGLIANSGKALIIAVNKWDGLESTKKNNIKDQLDHKLGFVSYACIHYISALAGIGINDLFASINKIAKSMSISATSADITAIMQKIVTAHAPPMVRGRRIKLRYAHIGGHNPIRIIIHGNQTTHLTTSYKRYIANKMRQQLKLVGTPVLVNFKQSTNPYKGNKNILTGRQQKKRRRLIRYVKSKAN